MVEFEGRPDDIDFINQQAEQIYLLVSVRKQVDLETVHTRPYCQDFTKELGPRLMIRWPRLQVIDNYDHTAGFGEVSTYDHSFLLLENNLVVDPSWQQFLPQLTTLQRLKNIIFPLPRVLITPKENLLRVLKSLGVDTFRYSPNWEI